MTKHFLNIILVLLVVSIIKDLAFAFLIEPESIFWQSVNYNLRQALNIIFDISLFVFVIKVKNQKIFKPAIFTILIVAIYFWLTHYFPIGIDRNGSYTKVMIQQFIISSPGLLNIIAITIFSIQLIKNDCNYPTKLNLKIIGFANLVIILLLWFISVVITDVFIQYSNQILTLIHLIYIVALLNLYYKEKQISQNEFVE